MQKKYSWLLLPPALALLLFLGPLREPRNAGNAPAPEAGGTDVAVTGSGVPAPPDLIAVASTTAGVLLLGLVVVLALGRVSRRGAPRGQGALQLRQSLRLSGRHAVHLVEIEGRLVLLGECDGSLSVLDRLADPAAEDVGPADEEGAVPRDLVIPRPATKRAAAPKPPRTAPSRPADLARFQTLLQAARKATQNA